MGKEQIVQKYPDCPLDLFIFLLEISNLNVSLICVDCQTLYKMVVKKGNGF